MAGYFPRDILIEIFLRAPVKTLVFCSCVCKSWLRIITDSRFIDNHVTRTRENNNNNSCNQKPLFLKPYRYGSTRSDDDAYSASDLVEVLDWPYLDLHERYANLNRSRWYILGSCNGLVLVSYCCRQAYSGCNFVIFNPSIRSLIHLPPSFGSICKDNYFGGVGFDSISGEYKVVIFSPEDFLRIYSLNTNSWKEVKYEKRHLYPTNMDRPVLKNGVLHWIARRKIIDDVYDYLILRFDVSREVYDTICLPKTIVTQPYEDFYFYLTVAFEKLCFGHSQLNGHHYVWIMNEYGVAESWTELCQFVDPTIDFSVVGMLGSHSNGELIMQSYDGQIVLWDPNSKRVKDLGHRNTGRSLYMDHFVESLVLFGSKNTEHYQLRKLKNY